MSRRFKLAIVRARNDTSVPTAHAFAASSGCTWGGRSTYRVGHGRGHAAQPPRVDKAEPVASPIAEHLPLPEQTDQLVKINAGVQIGAGVLLALGRLPRLAACVFTASLVPTTMAGPLWEMEEGSERAHQRIHFLKNLGLLGALVLAAVDTDGAPSLGWRPRWVAHRAREKVG